MEYMETIEYWDLFSIISWKLKNPWNSMEFQCFHTFSAYMQSTKKLSSKLSVVFLTRCYNFANPQVLFESQIKN